MPKNDNDTWWLVPVGSAAAAESIISRMPLDMKEKSVLLKILTSFVKVFSTARQRRQQVRNFARRAGHPGASPQPLTSLDGKQAWLHGQRMAKPTLDSLGPFTLQGVKDYNTARPKQFGGEA